MRNLLTFALLLNFMIKAAASDYYVSAGGGSDDTGDGTTGNSWQTITFALTQITGSGHTVHVATGTYDTTLGETFPILIKNGVSLVGAGMDSSIIDAKSTNSVVRCIGIVDISTSIEGFTIQGGYTEIDDNGAGIFISAGSMLKIEKNKITNNTCKWTNNSGIVYITNSTPIISENIIKNNDYHWNGSGIYIFNASPKITYNSIINNTGSSEPSGICIEGSSSSPKILNTIIAGNSGYGIHCASNVNPIIINNTISENTGDGIYIYSASPDSIFNNIISLNSGYGIRENSTASDPGKAWYNLFYANEDGLYLDEGSTSYFAASLLNTGVIECENNLDGDPLFVDRINSDYHLHLGSPAIDSGDPAFIYSLEPSPNGERVNIGAYGNTTEAATSDSPPTLPVNIYVDATNGSNITGNGTSGSPWQTITFALTQITGSGHTVYVAAGTYDTALGETFPIIIKNGVSLVGIGMDSSIIDAKSTNSVVRCIGIVDISTSIEGFTIQGGYTEIDDNGAGIFISAGSMLKIEKNKITNNTCKWTNNSGIVYITNSTPIISENIIKNNDYHWNGSGIYIFNASPKITYNSIINNTGSSEPSGICIEGSSSSPKILNTIIAGNSGYGIHCASNVNPIIINNTISENTGDGIYIYSASPDSIFNNIISLNSGYGIRENSTASDPGKAWYNLFYANEDGLYLDEGSTSYFAASLLNTGVIECENNLDGDPLFVDRINSDYHLHLGSPAIDGGDPNSPSDPDGTRADIGALYCPQGFFIDISTATQGEQSGDIDVNYLIINSNSTEASLLCEYKDPLTSVWQVASVTGDTSQLQPENYDGLITWNSTMDLPAVDIENLMFRITPRDDETGSADSIIFHLDNNEPPTVEISDPAGEQEGYVTINYSLSDNENDTLSILCEYYDDDASGWVNASITEDTAGITDYYGSITWNTIADLPTAATYVMFRITPKDLDPGTSDTTEFILDNIGVPVLIINTQLTGEQAGDILFEYTISDDEKDIISLSPEYSADAGETWHDASITGNTTGIDSLHYSGSLIWHSDINLSGADLLTVRFRIVPDDGNVGISSETINFHLDNNAVPSIVLDNKYEVHDRDITINYSLYDSEYDTLSIFAEYYESSTYAFIYATITGDTTSIDSSEYSGNIVWQYINDLPDISDTVFFRVTVMDKDTGQSDTIKILPFLRVAITTDKYSICNGESLQLTAIPEGGTGTYQYSWSSDPSGFSSSISNPVVSPDTSTNYTVSVNDGENTVNKSVTITVNVLPHFEIAGESEPCANQLNEYYSVENNPDYLYDWNIIGGDIISGKYSYELTVNWGSQPEGSKVSLTATDNETGCNITEDFIVNILPSPDKPEIMLKGQQLLICPDSGIYSYQWYKDNLPVENQTRQFYFIAEPELSANYYVEAVFENSCRTISDPFQLNTKSNEIKGFNSHIEGSLILYPNPNEGIFHLVIINEINAKVKISVRDYCGRILKNVEVDKQSHYLATDINIIDLINGLYFIEVTFNKETYLRKIILNK